MKRIHRHLLERAAAEYEAQRPRYVELAGKLRDLLQELLVQETISFQAIEHRAKTIGSVKDKLARPSKAYKNGLADMTDLCGLRIITYTLTDVKRVCSLIEQEFIISLENSVDKGLLLAPSEFGYRSRHFVVQLSAARKSLAEWKRFAEINVEIQVRTVLEHAWAAIDHSLRYKRDEDVPREQKRTLFRLSALLEMADESFDKLKEEQANLLQDATRRLGATSGESPELDIISYPLYAQSSDVLNELMNLALQSGFADGREEGPEGSSQSELIAEAKALGLRTIGDLDRVLHEEKDRCKPYLRALAEKSDDWLVTPEFIALLCLMRRDPTLTVDQLVMKDGWTRSIAERVISTASAYRSVKR